MSDRPQFDYLDELAAQMKKAPSNPWDDKKTAEGNWWAGVYSMIRALRAASVEPPVPGKEKTRHSPEGEAEQDAKLLSSKTSLSGVEPPVLTLQNEIMKLQREVVALTEARDEWVRHAGDAVAYAESLKSEPPVLSREFLDSLIEALPLPYRTDPPTAKWAKEGAKLLADAILESLPQSAPPVLSRARLNEIMETLPCFEPHQHLNGFRVCQRCLEQTATKNFIDAILESLSQEAG